MKLSSLFNLAWKKGTCKYEDSVKYLERIKSEWGGFYGLIGKVRACYYILFYNYVVVDFDIDELRDDLSDFKKYRKVERERIHENYKDKIERLESENERLRENNSNRQSEIHDLTDENWHLKKAIEIKSNESS